jgi:1-acyl-sn-glycerol-3-phosphate acyltransferase
MIKLISYPVSVIYYFAFGLALLVFHPIQWVGLNVFGYNGHKAVVDVMNGVLIRVTHLLGTTYKIQIKKPLPENVPLIFVSNHQSLYDISPFFWFMRKHHPKFISKIELGKGIPSVSYNLRHGGSALIDRKNPKQSIPEIKKIGEYIEKNNRAVVIFPEGTRSKTGKPKEFAESGLKILCKYAPSAYIVPVTINNSWKMQQYGYFPVGLGSRLEFIFHEPFQIKGEDIGQLIKLTEQTIVQAIK